MRIYFNPRLASGWIYIVITSVGGAALVAIVSRYLPPAVAGSWFTLQSLAAFVYLGDLGFTVTGARQVAHTFAARPDELGQWKVAPGMVPMRHGLDGVSDVNWILQYLQRYMVAVACLIATILSVFWFSTHVRNDGGHTIVIAWILLICATLWRLDAIRFQSLLEGIGRVDVERLTVAFTYLFAYIFAVGTVILTRSLVATALIWMIGMAGARAILAIVFRKVIGKLPTPSVHLKPKARQLLKISLPVWIVSIGAAATIYAQAPIINMFLGAAAIPGYYFAARIINTIGTGLGVFVQADRALFTQDLAAGDVTSAYRRLKRGLLFVGIGCLVMMIGFIAVGKWIVVTWIKQRDAIDMTTIVVLAVNGALTTFMGQFGQFVLATGKNPFVKSVLLSGASNIIFLFIFVPRLGVFGAAVAAICAGLFTSYWFNAYVGIKLIRSLKRKISSSLLVT